MRLVTRRSSLLRRTWANFSNFINIRCQKWEFQSKPTKDAKVVVKHPGEAEMLHEPSKTYLGEDFVKIKPIGQGLPPPSSLDNPPMRISSLNHAAIEADDVDAICEFYVDVLGFSHLPRPDLGFRGHWLQAGGSSSSSKEKTQGKRPSKFMLHIIDKDPSVPRAIECWTDVYNTKHPEAWYIRRACHLAFEVEDFEAAEHALRHHGVEYSQHVLPEVGLQQIFLYDPDGHGIEIGVYDDSREFFKEQGIEPPS